jgi:cell division protein FtsL
MSNQNQQGKTHLLLMLIVALAAVAGWQVYEMRYDLNVANRQVADLTGQLRDMQGQIDTLRKDVTRLDDGSVQGIVREANDAILTGWETLVNTVESELRKAREDMEKSNEQAPSPSQEPDHQSPNTSEPMLESDDGTDKT